ncbi:MAG: MATE family efflux transporter [Wenzhouxiangellaceae bacterium]
MQKLTQGSILRHLVALSAPIAVGMIFQNLYYLVDLYFVAPLGDAAVAGLSAAGNVQFLVIFLTQTLSVGSVVLIAHAYGRDETGDANLIFNQSLALALACAALTWIIGYGYSSHYMGLLASDSLTRDSGAAYLYGFLPGLGLQFALVAMAAGLRGSGETRPAMLAQMTTVLINILLAPVLISGWLTGHPLGTAGAGLASSIAIACGVLFLFIYFIRSQQQLRFNPALFAPRISLWLRMLRIGLPAGGEFALMFIYVGVVYWLISDFGRDAQAGFGIGFRVMQLLFLPAVAIAFGAAPLAAQNFSAGHAHRFRQTQWQAGQLSVSLMLLLSLICLWRAEWFIRVFSADPQVIAVGAEYLRYVALVFVVQGINFIISAMFQALGHTLPALLSSASRLLTFVLPAVVLAHYTDYTLAQIWLIYISAMVIQAVVGGLLLRQALRERLTA